MRRYEQAKRGLDTRWLARRLLAVAGVCLLMRTAAAGLEGGRAARFPEGLGRLIVTAELPGNAPEGPGAGTLALMSELPGFAGAGTAGGVSRRPDHTSSYKPRPPADTADSPQSTQESPESPASQSPQVPDGPEDDPAPPPAEEAPERDAIGTTITGAGGGYTGAGDGIYMKNETGYPIDVEAALAAPLPFELGCSVLIIHTHGSEAYNPTEEDSYVPSDPSRTEDTDHNMIRVGEALAEALRERGVTVYHDTSLYDYPSYTGSYDRSLEGAERFKAQHPEIEVIIDLHRDALEGDGIIYKTVADVGDTPCAQVMVICGTDAAGIQPEPDWHINLGVAVKLQYIMNQRYPTLARPMRISQYRYNQNVAPGGLLVEVGTNGNTLREAITAAQYLGQCLADLILGADGN